LAAPCRISNFYTATAVAMVVVVIELLTISWIQWRYMDVSPLSAAAKVMAGAR
jgi:erythrin-vacuolar iron transport family protein